MKLLEIKNLTVKRKKSILLDKVDLTINRGDFITIIGPNGAGKTTLLKSIIGSVKPSSGVIKIAADIKIGYQPQRIHIDKSLPLTVDGFLRLKNNFNQADCQATIKLTAIESLLTKELSALSAGELQRVLFAQALLMKPQLLILDEPAQNLDVPGQLKFYALVEKVFKSTQMAILMVSHDLHLVMSCSNQVVCLYKHICCSGSPRDVTKKPEFLNLFGKEFVERMSFYEHNHNHNHDRFIKS